MKIALTKLFATQAGPAVKIALSKKKEVAIALLLVIILYQNLSDTRWLLGTDTIPHLKQEIQATGFELDLALQANMSLRNAIEDNNARITAWEDLSEIFEARTVELQGMLLENRRDTNARVRTIIKEVAPASCTAAFEYLRDSIPELQYNDIINGDS